MKNFVMNEIPNFYINVLNIKFRQINLNFKLIAIDMNSVFEKKIEFIQNLKGMQFYHSYLLIFKEAKSQS